MPPAPWVAFLMVTAAFAGCLADGPSGPGGTGPVDPALAFVVEHDHLDLAEHAVGWNLTQTDWNGIFPKGTPSGAHAVDLNGDLLVVALHALAGESENGFALFDVSEPTLPKLVHTYIDERATGGDRMAMFSADGKTVFLGAEHAAREEITEALVLAIDVSDPTAPKQVAEAAVPPYGPHTVFAAEVDGRQFVYVVSFGVHVFEFTGTEFTLVGRYAAATPGQLLKNEDGPEEMQTYAFRDVYAHDVFAWQDPVDGRHIAFVAHAYEGLKIVDLTDPRTPRELGTFVPDGPDAPSYVHTVTVRMIGDRRIAAVGAETFEGRNRDVPSPVWFLDVTDLTAPVLLSTYTNPAGVGSNDLLLSAHDMRFDEVCAGVDGSGGVAPAMAVCHTYLWLAHYHAGVWVLDVDDPAAPTVAGFYLPHEDQGFAPPENCCEGLRMSGNPSTFDVIARNGVGYAADMWSGLYTLRLGS